MEKSTVCSVLQWVVYFWGFLILMPAVALAQNAEPIPKISGNLVFDGKLNEPFWDRLDPLDMTMYQPIYRGEVTEENEIYLVYDENYIYLAAQLYHENPQDIRSNSLFRDEYSSDDTFALILDTFNDNKNAVWFFTNPAGTRYDILVSNDAQQTNFNWDTYWSVETARNDSGWSVEMRIPFSSLRFQSEGDEVVMGAIVYRYLSKLNERYIYPDIPPNWDNGSRKPSQAKEILLHDINNEQPIYVTPYLLGGFKQRAALNADQTAYPTNTTWTHEPGADIKLNLTSNLTMDLTVNTDFAQVEADNQQINLTRFPLFFPEKRDFFQERSSVFDFGFTRDGRLFHSRRIGLSPTGEPIRIYGGARLVGKLNETDIGFLNMQTAASTNLPSENFTVMRAKKEVFNQRSSIGGMFTSRIGPYNHDNYGYGLDAILNVTGDEYLTLKLAQTYQNQNFDLLTNSRIFFQWQRRRNNGLSYRLDYDRSGSNFNPEIGFTRRTDFTLIQKQVQYKWITNSSTLFESIWVNNFANAYVRNSTENTASAVINPHIGADFKSGASFTGQLNIRYENLLNPFPISEEEGVIVPAGTYWYPDWEMSLGAPSGWKFRPGISLGIGGFFDGKRQTLGLNAQWNISSHFKINSEYEFNSVQFTERDQEFSAHIARLRLRTALNTQLSLSSFVQYNSDIAKTSVNARFRYNFGEGKDLWIVYDNVANTERAQPNLPTLPRTSYQALLVKFTYSFKL